MDHLVQQLEARLDYLEKNPTRLVPGENVHLDQLGHEYTVHSRVLVPHTPDPKKPYQINSLAVQSVWPNRAMATTIFFEALNILPTHGDWIFAASLMGRWRYLIFNYDEELPLYGFESYLFTVQLTGKAEAKFVAIFIEGPGAFTARIGDADHPAYFIARKDNLDATAVARCLTPNPAEIGSDVQVHLHLGPTSWEWVFITSSAGGTPNTPLTIHRIATLAEQDKWATRDIETNTHFTESDIIPKPGDLIQATDDLGTWWYQVHITQFGEQDSPLDYGQGSFHFSLANDTLHFSAILLQTPNNWEGQVQSGTHPNYTIQHTGNQSTAEAREIEGRETLPDAKVIVSLFIKGDKWEWIFSDPLYGYENHNLNLCTPDGEKTFEILARPVEE